MGLGLMVDDPGRTRDCGDVSGAWKANVLPDDWVGRVDVEGGRTWECPLEGG